MKYIKSFLALLIFVIACPASWFLAWKVGGFGAFIISLLVPTWGLLFFILTSLLGRSIFVYILIWGLSILGALVSISVIKNLLETKSQ